MIDLYWYLATIALLVVASALWETISQTETHSVQDQFRHFAGVCVEISISSIAYWVLVFILSLAIATALWLILLLIIWVPSDFFQNYVGLEFFSKALHTIKPLMYRSSGSPGITAIPLLDYISLYSSIVLGPLFGIWSILSKYQEGKSPSNAES